MTKVAGILSPSYSGSTVLGLVLDGLLGIRFVGETHWIHDEPDGEMCFECPIECPVFSRARLDALRRSTYSACEEGALIDWWGQLSKLVGEPDVLVTGDKTNLFYDLAGPPDTWIVPYRSLTGMTRSWLSHQGRAYTDENVKNAAEWVVSHYDMFLSYIEASGLPWIGVDIERFNIEADVAGSEIAKRLNVEWVDGSADFGSSVHHHIRGSRTISGRAVVPDSRWRRDLSAEQIVWLQGQAKYNRICAKLGTGR